MSILSSFNSNFIQYLYDNDLKIQTYERYLNRKNKKIYGFWAFLRKFDEKGYVSQLYYHIDKKNIFLKWRSITCTIKKQIIEIVVLYFLLIYGDSYNYSYSIENIEYIENIKNEKSNYTCFLCSYLEELCIICECYKNKINVFGKIIKIFDPKYINDNCVKKIKDLKEILFRMPDSFSSRIFRNYLDKKNYFLNIQEYITFKSENDENIYSYSRDNMNGRVGYLCFGKNEKHKNMIDFTFTKLCKKNILHIRIKQNFIFNSVNLTKYAKKCILHLLSCYSYTEVIVRFPKYNIALYNFFKDMNFFISNREEKSRFYANFYGFKDNKKTITMTSRNIRRESSYRLW